MDIQTFINQTMNGEAAAAKDTLNDLISARAFEALDARKQQIAQTLYADGKEATETEEQETETTEQE